MYSEYNAKNAGDEVDDAPDTFAGLQKQGYARPAPVATPALTDMSGGMNAGAAPSQAPRPVQTPDPYRAAVVPPPPPPAPAAPHAAQDAARGYTSRNPEEIAPGAAPPQSAEAYNAQYATPTGGAGGINLNNEVAQYAPSTVQSNAPAPGVPTQYAPSTDTIPKNSLNRADYSDYGAGMDALYRGVDPAKSGWAAVTDADRANPRYNNATNPTATGATANATRPDFRPPTAGAADTPGWEGPTGVTPQTGGPYYGPGSGPTSQPTYSGNTNTGSSGGYPGAATNASGYGGDQGGDMDLMGYLMSQLKNQPTGYDNQALKDEFGNLSLGIDDEFTTKDRDLEEEMARRGLSASSIYGGRSRDLNVAKRSAKTQLASDLATKRSTALTQGQQSWYDRLFGLGQQGFNNDMASATFNQNQQALYDQMLRAMLGAGA